MRAQAIARAARLAALALALLCALSATLAAEEKSLKGVALVIGQSKYAHIAPLANPANDAREMVKLLSDLGFDARIVSDRDAVKLLEFDGSAIHHARNQRHQRFGMAALHSQRFACQDGLPIAVVHGGRAGVECCVDREDAHDQ